MFNGKTHYKWPFSIAMLVYQSVRQIVGVYDLILVIEYERDIRY